MDAFIDLLKNCEVTTILAIFVGFWIFNGMMNKKLAPIREDIKRIDVDLKEIRTGLNRMEGAFYKKECCMLSSDQDKKAN